MAPSDAAAKAANATRPARRTSAARRGTGRINAKKMKKTVEKKSRRPYNTHTDAMLRRVATTRTTVTQTAANAENANERASVAAQVVLGSTAKITPATRAVGRSANSFVRTPTPAAAPPHARQLGMRDQASVCGAS